MPSEDVPVRENSDRNERIGVVLLAASLLLSIAGWAIVVLGK